MSKSWNHDRAAKHIDQKIADVEEITIKDYVRDMSLESIPTSTAYRVPRGWGPHVCGHHESRGHAEHHCSRGHRVSQAHAALS